MISDSLHIFCKTILVYMYIKKLRKQQLKQKTGFQIVLQNPVYTYFISLHAII